MASSSSLPFSAPWPPPGVELVGAALPDASIVAIALHGRHQDPDYLIRHLVTEVDSDTAVAWILPAASDGIWYPERADADAPTNDSALAAVLEFLLALIDRVDSVTAAPLVMAGFSQGACVACEFVAVHGDRVAALISLTGGLMGADPTRFSVAALPRPISALFTGGDDDPWISVDRIHATAAAFAAAGALTTVRVAESDAEHHIRNAEIAAVSDLLLRLAAPRA